MIPNQTRAVLRPILRLEALSRCHHCGGKFQGGYKQHKRVIVNVYKKGKWQGVEFWHPACYELSRPYGEVIE